MMTLVDYSPELFRFILYVFFGLTLEVVFATHGIELCMGTELPRRVPKKYLEGFTSLYMIPLHGIGILFGFEKLYSLIHLWAWPIRYLVWCVAITVMEVGWGFFLHRTVGFFTWDYYALSKFRISKHGYTMWTLVPMWGIAGMIVEQYSNLLIYLSPFVKQYFVQLTMN